MANKPITTNEHYGTQLAFLARNNPLVVIDDTNGAVQITPTTTGVSLLVNNAVGSGIRVTTDGRAILAKSFTGNSGYFESDDNNNVASTVKIVRAPGQNTPFFLLEVVDDGGLPYFTVDFTGNAYVREGLIVVGQATIALGAEITQSASTGVGLNVNSSVDNGTDATARVVQDPTSASNLDYALEVVDRLAASNFIVLYDGSFIFNGANHTINGPLAVNGNIISPTAGYGFQWAEGAGDAKAGIATLVGGTVTVANTAVAAGDRITLTVQSPGGIQGFLSIGTITAATSFVINSTNPADTSTVYWQIWTPAP